MSSKRRLRKRACESKIAYSEEESWGVWVAYRKRFPDAGKVNRYRCKFCGKWHIGRPKRKKGKIRKVWDRGI